MLQHTVRQPIHCQGVGLHSGKKAQMTLRPAPAGHGVVFKRLDVRDRNPLVPARYDRVADTRLSTGIANEDGVAVNTVEHLMAALYGCGVDNLTVELNGPEVPIMDGSSKQFVALITGNGTRPSPQPRRIIKIQKPVTVESHGAMAQLLPGEGFSVAMEIDFADPAIGRQALALEITLASFQRELCDARTFGFVKDVEALQKNGLALGAGLQNAVGVQDGAVLNPEGTRYPDEFVRHKMLDCIGDMALAGGRIVGRYRGYKASHALNNMLLRKLFEDPANWVEEAPAPQRRITFANGYIRNYEKPKALAATA